MTDAPFDAKLLDYANTPLQRERLEAWLKHGKQAAAARACGCSDREIRRARDVAARAAARAGYAPGHFVSGVAPGNVMGKVTVQRNAAGEVLQTWERQSPGDKDWSDIFGELLGGMSGLPAASPRTYTEEADDLLYVVPIGDAHFGLYAWAGDTGDTYDLQTASDRHRGGIDALMAAAPACKRAVILNLGDFFDSNCSKNRTPKSGHVMDPAGTYNEILAAACETTIYMIDRALDRAEEVEYVGLEGNHDPEASAALCAYVYAWYRNEPRVTCQLRPHVFWYLRYGKNLLGAHHGHGCKPADLPGVMAVDRREDWGEAEHCHWLIGHFHHKQLLGKEYNGATVEGFNTLAGNNLHHHAGGYRARLTITGILYHPEFGEWGRDVRNVKAIEAQQEAA
ncbi:MAG: hypothetical protein VX529_11055 [Pseudomonadota bacterium]|nr:hypothetical protein [Pseudomonadota bacterium]